MKPCYVCNAEQTVLMGDDRFYCEPHAWDCARARMRRWLDFHCYTHIVEGAYVAVSYRVGPAWKLAETWGRIVGLLIAVPGNELWLPGAANCGVYYKARVRLANGTIEDHVVEQLNPGKSPAEMMKLWEKENAALSAA